MSHDPLCPCAVSRHPGCLASANCPDCQCDLIARVREDERAHGSFERSYNEGYYNGRKDERKATLRSLPAFYAYNKGRSAALRDAVEAVKALPLLGTYNLTADAVAAIEALGGER